MLQIFCRQAALDVQKLYYVPKWPVSAQRLTDGEFEKYNGSKMLLLKMIILKSVVKTMAKKYKRLL